MSKVIVITGGSSGIGLAAARLLAKEGNQVYELSRSGVDNGVIRHLDVDLAKEEQIAQAFARIGGEAGHIDVLVNNASMGIFGPVELTESEDARYQLEVSFFAVFLCCKYALPWLRQAKGGARILNISSLAGVYALPYQAFYSVAKFGVNALTLALANELHGSGISVAALMPGDVKTGFTAARRTYGQDTALYAGVGKSLACAEKDEQTGSPPEKLAARIVQLINKKRLKPLYSCGLKFQFFLFLDRILPTQTANWIVRKMYS